MSLSSGLSSRNQLLDALKDPQKLEKQLSDLAARKKSVDASFEKLTKAKTLKKFEADIKKSISDAEQTLADLQQKISAASEQLAKQQQMHGDVCADIKSRQASIEKAEKEAENLNKKAIALLEQASRTFEQADAANQQADDLKRIYEQKLSNLKKYLKGLADG